MCTVSAVDIRGNQVKNNVYIRIDMMIICGGTHSGIERGGKSTVGALTEK
jgi:hypothetical protein